MKLNFLLIINAIIAAAFGIVILLVPVQFGSMYGFTATPELTFIARLLGVYLFAAAVLSWLIRNAPASDARKFILYSFLSMDVLGFVIALIYQLNGVVNVTGWSTVVIYLLLGLGFGYFLFTKPKSV